MGVGLYALAGALQGAGKGMTMQAESDVVERRNAAIEAARRENMEREYQLRDQNSANESRRSTTSQIAVSNNTAANQTAIAGAGAEAKAKSEQAQREHERNMAILNNQLETSAEMKKKAFDRETEWGKPIDTYTADDGTVTAVYPGGKKETFGKVGSTAAAKAKDDGLPSVNNGRGPVRQNAAAPDMIWDPKTGTFKPAGER